MKTSPTFLAPAELKPGWYHDVPDDVYHSWDLRSNSRMNTLFEKSAAHLRYELDHREEFDYSKPIDTGDALPFGAAIHRAVLQPELFDAEYLRCRDGLNLTKNVDKDWLAKELSDRPGRKALRANAFDAGKAICESVWGNLDARIILESSGDFELSGIALGPDEVLNKIRIDKLSEQFMVTADLKSCRSASPRMFEKEIYNHGYHRQGSFYVDNARRLGATVRQHVIIAVEKTAPYVCVVYKLSEQALELGRAELVELEHTYKQCAQTGIWPGYPDGVVTIGVPAWALKRSENDYVS